MNSLSIETKDKAKFAELENLLRLSTEDSNSKIKLIPLPYNEKRYENGKAGVYHFYVEVGVEDKTQKLSQIGNLKELENSIYFFCAGINIGQAIALKIVKGE